MNSRNKKGSIDYERAYSGTANKNTRYGFSLSKIRRRHREFLLSNSLLGWSKEDMIGMMIMQDTMFEARYTRRTVMLDEQDNYMMITDGLDKVSYIDWSCVHCHKKIQSKLSSVKKENFLCDICVEKNIRKVTDSSLIKISTDFTEECKKHIRKRQEYIQKNLVRLREIRCRSKRAEQYMKDYANLTKRIQGGPKKGKREKQRKS